VREGTVRLFQDIGGVVFSIYIGLKGADLIHLSFRANANRKTNTYQRARLPYTSR
jgi:hypothetical protein